MGLLGISFSEFVQPDPNGKVYVHGQWLGWFCSFWLQSALKWQERANPNAQRLFTCSINTFAVILLPKASHVSKPRVWAGRLKTVCTRGELYIDHFCKQSVTLTDFRIYFVILEYIVHCFIFFWIQYSLPSGFTWGIGSRIPWRYENVEMLRSLTASLPFTRMQNGYRGQLHKC